MEFFKKTQISFMHQRHRALWFSAFILVASLSTLFSYGLNWGLDFTGGTQITIKASQPISSEVLKSRLLQKGLDKASIQHYAGGKQVVRFQENLNKTTQAEKIVQSVLPIGSEILAVSHVGPQVGKQLLSDGILAMVLCFFIIMLYIAVRFDYRFALSAAIALIHDPLLILGVFSGLHKEFNLIVLTAILTVIGYSLNDTIVVYDRIRENFKRFKNTSVEAVLDLSVNQTLSRTIMTSGLTLLVVIILFFFGGDTIHDFSFALILGILVGTYSSIYIASALALRFGLKNASFCKSQH